MIKKVFFYSKDIITIDQFFLWIQIRIFAELDLGGRKCADPEPQHWPQ